MQFTAEYTWLESYLDNDSLWLEDTLNWDDAFDLATSDYNLFSFLTSPFFFNSHFFLDSIVKLSFLDILFLNESNHLTLSRELFDCLMWDLTSSFLNSFFPTQFFFFTDYQDFMVIALHHSPELSAAILDFINSYWLNSAIGVRPSAVFDLFNDSLVIALSEFLEYFVAFFIFIWIVIFSMNLFRILKWNNVIEAYLIRIHSFLFSLSRENRLQLEAVLTTIFIFVLYFGMMIATLDDDQEELMETFTSLSFYTFLGVFIYFLYRYSIHYFSFLAASDTKREALSIFSQFLVDLLDTVGLLLRFLVLMARLNLYDFLDDVLDSYYLLVCDFDDDEYFSDLFFSIFSTMFFDSDLHDDRSFFLEDEIDLSNDLFSLYFILWAKFSLFLFFSIEEALRVLLAFYVTYLVIFEMQAVNRSYIEDTYLFKKRQRFSDKVSFNNI